MKSLELLQVRFSDPVTVYLLGRCISCAKGTLPSASNIQGRIWLRSGDVVSRKGLLSEWWLGQEHSVGVSAE